jgi:hypothetical protein
VAVSPEPVPPDRVLVVAAWPRSAVGAVAVVAVCTPLLSDSVPKSVWLPAFTGVATTGCRPAGCTVAVAPAATADCVTACWPASPVDPADAEVPPENEPDPNDAAGATGADSAPAE